MGVLACDILPFSSLRIFGSGYFLRRLWGGGSVKLYDQKARGESKVSVYTAFVYEHTSLPLLFFTRHLFSPLLAIPASCSSLLRSIYGESGDGFYDGLPVIKRGGEKTCWAEIRSKRRDRNISGILRRRETVFSSGGTHVGEVVNVLVRGN